MLLRTGKTRSHRGCDRMMGLNDIIREKPKYIKHGTARYFRHCDPCPLYTRPKTPILTMEGRLHAVSVCELLIQLGRKEYYPDTYGIVRTGRPSHVWPGTNSSRYQSGTSLEKSYWVEMCAMIWSLDIEPAIDERSVVHSLVFDPDGRPALDTVHVSSTGYSPNYSGRHLVFPYS